MRVAMQCFVAGWPFLPPPPPVSPGVEGLAQYVQLVLQQTSGRAALTAHIWGDLESGSACLLIRQLLQFPIRGGWVSGPMPRGWNCVAVAAGPRLTIVQSDAFGEREMVGIPLQRPGDEEQKRFLADRAKHFEALLAQARQRCVLPISIPGAGVRLASANVANAVGKQMDFFSFMCPLEKVCESISIF